MAANETAKAKIGVLGASGYTGSELVRLLLRHPRVEIVLLTADRRAGQEMRDGVSAVLAVRAAEAGVDRAASTGPRPASISPSARCRMPRRRR